MKCPKCGSEMVGGAPHGPWPVQWECRQCGTIVVPPRSKRPSAEQVAETLRHTLWACHTWGQLERAAGITDREEWWKSHPTEASAKAALTELLRERIRAGVVQ